MQLKGRDESLPCPKCGWRIYDLILAADQERRGNISKMFF